MSYAQHGKEKLCLDVGCSLESGSKKRKMT